MPQGFVRRRFLQVLDLAVEALRSDLMPEDRFLADIGNKKLQTGKGQGRSLTRALLRRRFGCLRFTWLLSHSVQRCIHCHSV